jgi:hypothetical protein
MEFGVTRFDEPAPPKLPSGKRYPAVRLVLSVTAAADLINKVQQVAGLLQQTGVIKLEQPMPMIVPQGQKIS